MTLWTPHIRHMQQFPRYQAVVTEILDGDEGADSQPCIELASRLRWEQGCGLLPADKTYSFQTRALTSLALRRCRSEYSMCKYTYFNTVKPYNLSNSVLLQSSRHSLPFHHRWLYSTLLFVCDRRTKRRFVLYFFDTVPTSVSFGIDFGTVNHPSLFGTLTDARAPQLSEYRALLCVLSKNNDVTLRLYLHSIIGSMSPSSIKNMLGILGVS